MISEYALGINEKGREMFLPVSQDITQTYQHAFGRDKWVSFLVTMKSKYSLTASEVERCNCFLALLRTAEPTRHNDYFKQSIVEFIEEHLR